MITAALYILFVGIKAIAKILWFMLKYTAIALWYVASVPFKLISRARDE